MCMYLLSKQVTGQLSLSCFHSLRKTTTPFRTLRSTWDYSILQCLQSSSFFFFPFSIWNKISNSTTQTSLKPMAFAQVQPTVKAILSIPTEISKCSSKFCSEVDKVQDTINMNYFMLQFSNVQHWAPSWSQFFGFGGSNYTNTDVMEGKKQTLVFGEEGRKKKDGSI